MFTVQRDCEPERSIFFTNLIICGSRSRSDHAPNTVGTGRPMLMLFSRRRIWLSRSLENRLKASTPPMPANAPNAAPAAKPDQKFSRSIRFTPRNGYFRLEQGFGAEVVPQVIAK